MVKGLALVLVLVVLYFAAIYLASEWGGEVVTLERPNAEGGADRVRVWVVDLDSTRLIEHGTEGDGWLAQLASRPKLNVHRLGQRQTFLGVMRPDLHAQYHRLRREKYGWADQFLETLTFSDVDSCKGMPVELR